MLELLMTNTAKKLLKKIEAEYAEHMIWRIQTFDDKGILTLNGVCDGLEIAHRIVCEHFGIENSMPVIDPDDGPCPPPPKGED